MNMRVDTKRGGHFQRLQSSRRNFTRHIKISILVTDQLIIQKEERIKPQKMLSITFAISVWIYIYHVMCSSILYIMRVQQIRILYVCPQKLYVTRGALREEADWCWGRRSLHDGLRGWEGGEEYRRMEKKREME